jgi:transcriptional regulator with XRE-family HTH domain
VADKLEGERDTAGDTKIDLRRKAPIGAPTKLDQEMADKMGGWIRAGATRASVAKAAGIGVQTLWRWLRRGRKEWKDGLHTIHAYLAQTVENAEGDRQVVLEQATYGHALKDGAIGLRALSKYDRETWGDAPTAAINVHVNVTPDVRLLAERLTPDELAQLGNLLAKAFGPVDAPDGGSAPVPDEPDGVHAIDVPGVPTQLASSSDS